jgi:hypothetical protein
MTRLHIAKTKTRTGPALVYTPHAADGSPYLLDVCAQNVTRSTILHHSYFTRYSPLSYLILSAAAQHNSFFHQIFTQGRLFRRRSSAASCLWTIVI